MPSSDISLGDMYASFQVVRETNLQEGVSTAESRRQASFQLVLQSLKHKCKECTSLDDEGRNEG